MRWPLLRVAVAERSMQPTLQPGDWLLVLRTRRVRPGQLVVAWHPSRPALLLVKRTARREPGGWWLQSDSPNGAAVDSRTFGPVQPGLIEGRVLLRYRRGARLRARTPLGPVDLYRRGRALPAFRTGLGQCCRRGSGVSPDCRLTRSSISCLGSRTAWAQ